MPLIKISDADVLLALMQSKRMALTTRRRPLASKALTETGDLDAWKGLPVSVVSSLVNEEQNMAGKVTTAAVRNRLNSLVDQEILDVEWVYHGNNKAKAYSISSKDKAQKRIREIFESEGKVIPFILSAFAQHSVNGSSSVHKLFTNAIDEQVLWFYEYQFWSEVGCDD